MDMRRALRALPENARLAVVLRYYLDLPSSEIAVLLGCSENAAKVRVAAPSIWPPMASGARGTSTRRAKPIRKPRAKGIPGFPGPESRKVATRGWYKMNDCLLIDCGLRNAD